MKTINNGDIYTYSKDGSKVKVIASLAGEDECLVEDTITSKRITCLKAELLYNYEYKREKKKKIHWVSLVVGDMTFLKEEVHIHKVKEMIEVPSSSAKQIGELLQKGDFIIMQSESRKIIWL